MAASTALRAMLSQHKFTLVDGKWTHPDLQQVEVDDASLTVEDLARVRTLIGLVQEAPQASKYALMGAPHQPKGAVKLTG